MTLYYKGYSASKKVKIIHQYILREVSKMVIYYLQLIQLYVEILQMLYRGQDEIKAFLQEPELEERQSNSKNKEDRDNQERTNVVEQSDNKGRGKGDSKRARDISKLEKRVSNLNSFQGSNCVHRVIQQKTSNRINTQIFISIQRHVYPAIQREIARDKGVLQNLDLVYKNKESGNKIDNIQKRQSRHYK